MLLEAASCARGARANCGMGIADAAMRKERMMKTVALTDETDIVCGFTFKNVWRDNSLDKICGQFSSRMSQKGRRKERLTFWSNPPSGDDMSLDLFPKA